MKELYTSPEAELFAFTPAEELALNLDDLGISLGAAEGANSLAESDAKLPFKF